MRNLLVITIVALLSVTAFAAPPIPWIGSVQTLDVPVVMDIQPAATISLNGAQIKLEPDPISTTWSGVANPQPWLQSNTRVGVTALLTTVLPSIQTDTSKWGVALQGQAWTPAGVTTPSWDLDVAFIGAGVGIPIAAYVEDPDLTVRPPSSNSQVGNVLLTVTPF